MTLNNFFKIDAYKNQILLLESENSCQKENIKDLKNTITQKDYSIKRLEKEVRNLEDYIHNTLPFFDIDKIKAPKPFELFQDIWMKWGLDIHNSQPQLMRQDRACSRLLTPLSVNYADGSGYFRGKEIDYHTTLVNCECMDFQNRAKPCKHMYRLAYELDVFMLDDTEVEPNIKNLLKLSDAIQLIKPLSLSELQLLYDLLVNDGYRSLVRPSAVKSLISRGLIELSLDKLDYLLSFSKDDLVSMIPPGANIPKSTKKGDLAERLLSECPEVIETAKKFYVLPVIHKNIRHLAPLLIVYINKQLS